MKQIGSLRYVLLCASLAALVTMPLGAFGEPAVAPVSKPCPRFVAGGVINNPPAIFSSNGVLNVKFSYQSTTDSAGRLLYCFMTPDGLENPTLHVNPGDTINLTVTNNTPNSPVQEVFNSPNCGDSAMTGSSMNIHYHGANVTPQCNGDNVVKTLINSGHTFQYSFQIPTDEPPGLYWYHPHVHGIAEAALLGGATGALVVDGIENVQPAVAGMHEQIIVIRDQLQAQGLPEDGGNCGVGVPFQDITVNNIPINSHATFDANGNETGVTFTPAVLQMGSNETQFWRVTNSSADTILDLQVIYDGVPQTLQIVNEDGVPVNSQDGAQPGHLITTTDYRLPVAGRVEFLVTGPASSVRVARLVTNNINTGPQGDCDPTRTIFNIATAGGTGHAQTQSQTRSQTQTQSDGALPNFMALNTQQRRFSGTNSMPVTAQRVFQFSEVQPTEFFITQVSAGQTPTLFDNNNPPAVITTQGAVEQWTIQNVAQETHEFHLHQIHFKVLSQNNYEINGNPQNKAMNGQFLDMIEVPYWDNVKNKDPRLAPNAVLLLDFRGMDIGDFVYHCHILSHEDLGMMAVVRVLPPSHH